MIDPNVFNDVALFALLDTDERQLLAQHVSARNFAAGETIFQAGQLGGTAYLVQSGQVTVSITDVVHDIVIVDMVGPGGLLGMSSLLAGAEHLTTAVATAATAAIEIDRSDITILLQQKPLAGLDMMTMIEQQLRATHQLMRTRVARNPNSEFEEHETLGGRIADEVAKFGGSWSFVIIFSVILVVYVTINSMSGRPWDPYPFILLNLFLSMVAAMQAPVIMMSQNRQDAKDRLRGELDYRVNLKAEVEIGEVLLRMSRLEQQVGELTRSHPFRG